jgi:hypothetical protein
LISSGVTQVVLAVAERAVARSCRNDSIGHVCLGDSLDVEHGLLDLVTGQVEDGGASVIVVAAPEV